MLKGEEKMQISFQNYQAEHTTYPDISIARAILALL